MISVENQQIARDRHGHGEVAALRWNDIDLKRGIISISRSRDEGEDNAPKTAGSTREIPVLPWVVDLLRRLPRRLHSDSSEFVFLSPEGKPMTDPWWPKRGAARRPVDDESKGIWFRCLRSLAALEVLHDATHIHRLSALGGSQLERASRILRNVCGNDRAELRQVRPQGLPRASDRGPSKDPAKDRGWQKKRTNRTPLGGFARKAQISTEFWWRRGGN
jgi:integrase